MEDISGQVSEHSRPKQTLTKSSSGELVGRSRFVKEGAENVKGTSSECSICGDVGFVQQLLLCRRCGYRFQHTYCSKLYPDLDMESWACEWCLYEVEKNAAGIGATKSRPGKRKAVNLSLTESRSKAFEFLLQIAQASPASSSSTANNISGEEKLSLNISGEKKLSLNTGEKKVRDTGEFGRVVTKKEEGLKEENCWRLGFAENWNCKEENGVKSGAQVPKRQRCSHPNKAALDKWRNLPKAKLHCNTSKAIGRRYKLLADVLC